MKFIILCYPRTGSTLLITALGAHPNINQGMELFNPEQEGNDPWVHWRKATFEALYGSHDSYLNADGYLDGNRFDLRLLASEFFKVFDGTKIMYDQLHRRSHVWDYLRSWMICASLYSEEMLLKPLLVFGLPWRRTSGLCRTKIRTSGTPAPH